MCFLHYVVGLRKVWPFIGILTQLRTMLAGVSTTHNSNLQKLLPLTVPWLPAHREQSHSQTAHSKKQNPAHHYYHWDVWHVCYFTQGSGRISSSIATKKKQTLRQTANAMRLKWSGLSLSKTHLSAYSFTSLEINNLPVVTKPTKRPQLSTGSLINPNYSK